MTSQGTPHGRFARAIRNRNLLNAEIAARELGELALGDALALCLLLAEVDPPRFDRAIARWHARFVLEARGISSDEAVLGLIAAKGLGDLRTRAVAAHTLWRLAGSYGLMAVVAVRGRREGPDRFSSRADVKGLFGRIRRWRRGDIQR